MRSFGRRLALPLSAAIGLAACASAPAGDDLSPRASPATEAEDAIDGEDEETASPQGGGDVRAVGGARFVDTCDREAAECTAAPVGFAEGSGLAPVDRCAFALDESADLAATPEIVRALEAITTPVSFAELLADANRVASTTSSVPGSPVGVAYGFRWQADDDASEAWIPQGITGTADARASGAVDGKSAVLVSFYDKAPGGASNEGVRIAFVDTTTPSAPKYRFALLVMPTGSKEAPSFSPVKIHAGGIAWYGDYLYVADTTRGFRVFDMRHILRVSTEAGAFGCAGGTCRAATYKYVLPQVGKYEIASACKPIFSFVSLDRTSDPPALVSGEYCSTTACAGPLAGRIYRWPLDARTGLLRSKTTFPTDVRLMGQKQVQGGAAVSGTYYLSSSAPAGGAGELYRASGAATKSTTFRWSDTPEDLMVDAPKGWLWSLSEAPRERAVFASKLSSL